MKDRQITILNHQKLQQFNDLDIQLQMIMNVWMEGKKRHYLGTLL